MMSPGPSCAVPSFDAAGKIIATEGALVAAPYYRMLLLPIDFIDAPLTINQNVYKGWAIDAAEYWSQCSYNAVQFSYAIAPVYHAPINAPGDCNNLLYNSEALAAANSLCLTGNYPVYLMAGLQCVWGGIGNVGYGGAWLNLTPSGVGALVMTHELGHNLGYQHAHGFSCPGGNMAWTPACPIQEYGDPWDVMGSGHMHNHVWNKALMNWLPRSPNIGYPAQLNLNFDPLEGNTGGSRMVVMDRQDGTTLIMEYRQPVSLDTGSGAEYVVVRYSGFAGVIFIQSLLKGQTFIDSLAKIQVRYNGSGNIDIVTGSTPMPPPPVIHPIVYVTPPPIPTPEGDMDSTKLCLGPAGRFCCTVAWTKPDGTTGVGTSLPILPPTTGGFWFFTDDNLEVPIKVLDGTAVNGFWWVFFSPMTNVEFVMTVTDTKTGAMKTYSNAQGATTVVQDTQAFPK